MKKENFTSARVEAFKCADGRQQSIYWDGKTPGLELRLTASGSKSYIFEATLNGKTLRITIGDIRTWSISQAQTKATVYRAQTDSGIDPRKVAADQLAAEQHARQTELIAAEAAAALVRRDAITLRMVWPEYVAERQEHWSAHHLKAHNAVVQTGGEARKRSAKQTTAGPLASLLDERLVDLTSERLELWSRGEAKARPASARLAMRLLKAFLNWCAQHSQYAAVVNATATKSSKLREVLGKPKKKHDLLQREQLRTWFEKVRIIANPVIAAYLQTLLLTGARREELAALRWVDVDFRWGSMKLSDKIEDFRMVPLTPYVTSLLSALPRRNEWVFSSPAAESGRLAEPRIAHNDAVAAAGLPHLTLHGLRRSFATLSEWVETPAGIAAQIQGHAPQGVREQNYIRRPLDLLRMWHVKIEAWMLEQAGMDFIPTPVGLRIVTQT